MGEHDGGWRGGGGEPAEPRGGAAVWSQVTRVQGVGGDIPAEPDRCVGNH